METKKEKKKIYIGTVVSDKMDKTIVVKAERTFLQKYVNKIVKKTKKYKVHDEHKQAKKGDLVAFYEGRPYSKTKYMYLEKVLKPASLEIEVRQGEQQ
jgi:small subunit ribosomal protein S17